MVLQMEAVECGAASLAMVLAFHGRWVQLEELRVRCGVSRDGTKASNLLKVAREFGLSAKGFRKEPGELMTLPRPSIIHWNFNHFLVFEGIIGDTAYLNDPSLGTRRVSLAELEECFTGVVLAFEPSSGFVRGGAPDPVWRGLARRFRGSGDGLALVLLVTILLIVPGIIAPVFTKIFIDQVVVADLKGWLGPLAIGMALVAILRGAMVWLQSHYLIRLETKLGLVLGSQIIWHLLRLPAGFFAQRHPGDLATRVSSADNVAQLLSGGVASAVLGTASAVIFALAMLAFNVTLTALTVPIVLLNGLVVYLFSRGREMAAHRLYKERSLVAASTVGIISSIETIKASGLEVDAFSRWAGFHAKEFSATRAFDQTGAWIAVVPPFISALTNALLLGVGSLQVISGSISVGELVAFAGLAASFADPIERLVMLAGNVQEIKAQLARTSDILAYPTETRMGAATEDDTLPDSERPINGKLEIKGLSFGYNPLDPPLLTDFNLTVLPGARVALVGSSGSGKSTLGRLICGLYAPWRGEILLDGRPMAEIPRSALANSLAYVDQNIFLFEGTVRDNLTLWNRSVPEPVLASALQDCEMFEEIALRKHGLDAPVAEGGRNFSGGQRQRLELARALVLEPNILVLDEAMSALDPVVEEAIDDHLRRRGCSCITIAHRLSTIRDCDEIIMLSAGRVIGRGNHVDLMDSCPEYADLISAD
jgi:NHLM bacteriocin system ABC transporter peptidase/ATP-binding protein